jgi:hypothetical protein
MKMARSSSIILLLAFLMANHVHLPLMQVVAWSSMLISYSQDYSLPEALVMTFDGEHPCPMCKAIDQAREASTEHSLPTGFQSSSARELCGLSIKQKELFFPAYAYHHHLSISPICWQSVAYPPPTPPPISA